jgi:hypothetical protein
MKLSLSRPLSGIACVVALVGSAAYGGTPDVMGAGPGGGASGRAADRAARALRAAALLGVRYIPNDRVGLVEKRWSARGSVKSELIALRGEASYQPWILRGGLDWLMPLQYRVHRMAAAQVHRGRPRRAPGRRGHLPQQLPDPERFLAAGGRRGRQLQVLLEGTY